MRRGKEEYTEKYDTVMQMHKEGIPIKEIAKRLDISYSAVYFWVTGRRKPEAGSLMQFQSFLEKNGPTPAAEIKKHFPKHNDLFHISIKRNMGIKREILDKRYKEYRFWYFLDGQEKELENRIKELKEKRKQLKEKLLEALN